MGRFPHKATTDRVLKAFYAVYNGLGLGFLEKVYENAMVVELCELGVKVAQQRPITVTYRGQVVGEYFADIVADGKVILELKTVESLGEMHVAQLMNYLRATRFELGLLLNFGPKPEFRRILFTNDYKHPISTK
ncbi:MAG: GxxExxY protein [Verrucomicrobia bacterium]|nr:GxxExxY protein [Verrucomicrobiota bacterium]